MISLAWYIFVPVIVGAMALGFQIGSIVELKKGYNFADLEDDLLKSLYAQATAESKGALAGVSAEEKRLVARVAAGARKLEFWKKL